MKPLAFEKRLLRHLFSSNDGLLVFTLFQRVKITPSQLYLFIEKYKRNGIIEFNDEKITLTTFGRKEMIEKKLENKNQNDKFANIPWNFKGVKTSVNEFYIPKLSETSSIFKDK